MNDLIGLPNYIGCFQGPDIFLDALTICPETKDCWYNDTSLSGSVCANICLNKGFMYAAIEK